MEVWKAAGKDLTLFPSARDNAPLVLLHTCGDEGESVARQVRAMTDADHAFAAIGGLRWEDEMSPWECPPIFRGEPPFTGGADAYLALLTQEILPGILSRLSAAPAYLALAGYSLAGLFAVYASYLCQWHIEWRQSRRGESANLGVSSCVSTFPPGEV